MRGINPRRDGGAAKAFGFQSAADRRNRRGDAPPTRTPAPTEGPFPCGRALPHAGHKSPAR